MEAHPDEPGLSPTRRLILTHLAERPRTVCEVARDVGISKSAAFKHVKRLVDAGLATRRPRGRKFIYYDPTANGLTLVVDKEAPR